jgi:hypothetical protein
MNSKAVTSHEKPQNLQGDPVGIRYFPNWLGKSELAELDRISAGLEMSSVGRRIFDDSLRPFFTANGSLMKLAGGLLGPEAKAVRAVFFNKTIAINWSTPWHQDRTIAVRSKHILNGYETWSIKEGVHHVEPPISFLENMVTLKVYIDACPDEAGPVRVAEGSHRIGRVRSADADKVARGLRERICVAGAGDVWAMSSTILHASNRSTLRGQRRILHIDFSAEPLPGPLELYGVKG